MAQPLGRARGPGCRRLEGLGPRMAKRPEVMKEQTLYLKPVSIK